jgi:tetratricopeptide (TPR) repeat protein
MALTECEQEFNSTRRGEAGITAARAALRLGRTNEVLAWPDRLSGTTEAGTAWVLAGFLREQQRDNDRAKQAYLKALELHRAAGDARKTADVLYRLFFLSWRASAHREAFTFATEAFAAAATAGDRAQQLASLEALFTAVYEIGDLASAAHLLSKTEAVIAPDDRPARGRLLLHQGVVLLAQSRPELARAVLEDALQYVPAGDSLSLIRLRFNLIEAALQAKQLDEAERHLKAARQLAELGAADQNRRAALAYLQSSVDNDRGRYRDAAQAATVALGEEHIPEWQWSLQYQLARAEEARGRGRAAKAAYVHAVESVERLRASVGNDEFKDWLVEKRRAPFEALFRFTVRERDFAAALHVAERAKARAFHDAFIQNASASPPAETAWSADTVSDRLEALERILPAKGESLVAPLPTASQIVAAVADRHVLLYFQAGDQLWLLKVASGVVTGRSLGNATDIRRLAERFAGKPDDAELPAILGSRLLPANWLPTPGSTLYVVPDRALGTIPFAALRVNDRWLAETHVISYLPSVSALGALESVTVRPATAAVVIGDPRGDLAAAREEARWVAAHLRVLARTGSAATQQSLADASNGALLHVAAHTWLAPGGPWLGLADGRVSASTILRQRIRPAIAVLASCSGAGTRGSGYWGSWGAAFLAAGTRSVVAALWSVGDVHSREFVVRFYEEGGAVDAALALTRTQRAFIAAGRPPSFWSPFVHMGIALRSPAANTD